MFGYELMRVLVVRYWIKLSVDENTNSATFVVFDRDACYLVNKSCAEMLESIKKVSNCALTITIFNSINLSFNLLLLL